MPRLLTSVITLLLILALALTLGCGLLGGGGDGGNGINQPVIPEEGELTDPGFLFASEFIEPDILRLTEASLFSALIFLTSLPSLSPDKDTDIANASSRGDFIGVFPTSIDTAIMSEEGWYVFEFETTALYGDVDSVHLGIDSVFSTGLDSIRLTLDDDIVEWTSMGVTFDMMEYRYSANWVSNNESSGVNHHHVKLLFDVNQIFEITGAETMLVNDTTRTSFMDDGGFCYANLYTNAFAVEVQVDFNIDLFDLTICADSGFTSASTVVELDCTSEAEALNLDLEGVWLYDGSYQAEYLLPYKITHGNMFWHSTDTCEMP